MILRNVIIFVKSYTVKGIDTSIYYKGCRVFHGNDFFKQTKKAHIQRKTCKITLPLETRVGILNLRSAFGRATYFQKYYIVRGSLRDKRVLRCQSAFVVHECFGKNPVYIRFKAIDERRIPFRFVLPTSRGLFFSKDAVGCSEVWIRCHGIYSKKWIEYQSAVGSNHSFIPGETSLSKAKLTHAPSSRKYLRLITGQFLLMLGWGANSSSSSPASSMYRWVRSTNHFRISVTSREVFSWRECTAVLVYCCRDAL